MSASHKLVRTTLPASVKVEEGPGGLPRLAVQSRHGSAQVYFQGAHVAAWHPASSAAPVLWISRDSYFAPGKPIRGGVPICFPWFGPHATDTAAPGHGFARLRDWALVEAAEHADGAVELALVLTDADAASGEARALPPQWPHKFRLIHRIAIGPSLSMSLEMHNPSDKESLSYEEALHTYFAVQDVRHVTVTGLAGTDYLDKVTGYSRHNQGQDPVRFAGETDRVYLNTRATCVIQDPGKRRAITIRKTGSDATVVWNPWIDKARAMPDYGDDEWPEMVCVETCNVNVHKRTLGPGETHTMTAIVEVAPA